jgi:hypothetical protein
MIELGIFNVIKHERIVRGEGRGEQAAKGKKKILRGKRFSIRPLGILAKLEDPFIRSRRVNGIPFFRDSGHGNSIFGRMGFDQSFKK